MDCPPGTEYKPPTKVELKNGSFYETPGRCDIEKPVQIVEKPVYVERRVEVPKKCPTVKQKKVVKKRVTVKKAVKKIAKNPVKTVRIVARVVKKVAENPEQVTKKKSFRARLKKVVKSIRKRFNY